MNFAEKKLELLCYGAKLEVSLIKGRKSGAGPAGGTSFMLENGSVLNLPLWTKETNGSYFLLREDGDQSKIYTQRGQEFLTIQKIPDPKFYNSKTKDGILMKQVALLHGKDCLATTVFQRCAYWRSNLQCKFCAIEVSLEQGSTTSFKKHEQLLQVLEAGVEEGVIKHCTFTTGTLKNREFEIQNYVDLVKLIRKSSDIPIHVQLEPIDRKNLEILYSSGIDTIGLHVETFDEEIFKYICPGKYQNHSYDDYIRSWTDSVELFGKNQVSSFVLVGLGEDQEATIKGSNELLEIGVIPFLVPVRPLLNTAFNKVKKINFNPILTMHEQIIANFKKHKIDPTKNKAGCVRCNACSTITDFYNVLK